MFCLHDIVTTAASKEWAAHGTGLFLHVVWLVNMMLLFNYFVSRGDCHAYDQKSE
jgi:hypothetical protein